MDYRYLKEEVENEKNFNRKNFEEEYENRETELVEILCEKIIDQVKNSVKQYYAASEEVKNRMCRYQLKKPTLFRRSWILEEKLKDVGIHKVIEPTKDNEIYRAQLMGDGPREGVWIPESKFGRFWNLINGRLKKEEICVELLYDEYWMLYQIKIIANLGML